MDIFTTIRVALWALLRNKVRSFLTMLGIIIGISAVIAVVAVGEGATVMIKGQIQSMGNNLVTIFPGNMSRGGVSFGGGSRSTLTASDGDAIIRECSNIKAITPVNRRGAQVIFQEKNSWTMVMGVNTSYLEIRNWQMSSGSFFQDSDVTGATKVCILGATVVEEIFGVEDPVGQIIRVKNMPFRVLGTLEKKGSAAWGQDQDDVIVMPWTTVSRVIQNSQLNEVNQVIISLTSMDMLEKAKKEITALLRERHKLTPSAEDDFSIMDVTEVTKTITETSRTMTLLLGIIASISLLVGGIGIMNIMLVSVTERTREIGLRMAVGARGKDILMQFLVEATVLAVIGGIFGTTLGTIGAKLIAQFSNWPVFISVNAVLLAFVFSAVVGVSFGFFPAWRAARLNPIEALRYE
ncbi:MAG: ABC transporter permease [Planctomycetes bacterium]|nr:ABC transporter permease [Planctomycetota bacterium]